MHRIFDVRPSPVAGVGAFLAESQPPLRVGEALGLYHGAVLSAAEMDARYGRAELAPYALDIGHGLFIDATAPADRNWSAYINDARGSGRRPNVAFREWGVIVATRRVVGGEELLVSYGAAYWDDAQ